jgi:hypothetical protein
MPVAFDQKVSVAQDVLVNCAHQQTVLLNLQSERYFGLNEVGTRMWQELTRSASIQAAFASLHAEYEVGTTSCDRTCTPCSKNW